MSEGHSGPNRGITPGGKRWDALPGGVRVVFAVVAATAAALVVAGGAPEPEASRGRPPNLVLIVADDLGYGDLASYGHATHRTPHLDRLAGEGLRFTDFHANGPMCSPTRAALLTGLYQQRLGRKFENALSGRDHRDTGLPLEQLTLAEALSDAGYATGMFGKWHLGYRPPFTPTRQGFLEFRGLLSGDGDHHSHVDRSGREDWWRDERLEPETGYTAELITRHAVDFIERHADRPFFLYVPHLAIHFPWQGPDEPPHRESGVSYWSLAKLGPHDEGEVRPVVRAMVESVDASVGAIVAALERGGLSRDTLVFFTSDNGGYLDYQGRFEGEISSNGVLRGQKGQLWEGGHRVPAIARWPGRIGAGRESAATAMTMDLMPTFLELARAGAPRSDGVSLAPLLLDGEAPAPRDLFWRKGAQRAVRRGHWKLVAMGAEPPRLYDLASDLGEEHDLAAGHPERVTELLGALEEWENRVAGATESARRVEHVKVYYEPGMFGGWPANHGIWAWGDEILVGFSKGHYQNLGDRHHIDREKPELHMLARSLDGGETWAIEDPGARGQLLIDGDFLHGVARPGVAVPELREPEGGIDFTHPDFALTVRTDDVGAGTSRFFYSYDRGHEWEGPFRLPDFGAPGTAARTDYVVDGADTCTLFLTAAKANGEEGRLLVARTRDAGRTWKRVSWIGPEPEGFVIMPASVRLSDTDIFVAARNREGPRRWISAYLSTDDGETWAKLDDPVADTGIGNPPAVIRLRDGRLLLVYGYRGEPYSIRARLSGDGGRTWSDDYVLRDDGASRDIGYPRVVQRADGEVVAVYYFTDAQTGPERYIGATIWTPPDP